MFVNMGAASRAHDSVSTSTCNRPEVIGFAETRRKLWPFKKTLEVTHPHAKADAGLKTVIIIDLDELGATGSSQHGAAASASVGMHLFLSGLTVLAFYGTYASVHAIIDATRDLRSLTAQREALQQQLKAAGASDLTANIESGRLHALRRALRQNDEDKVRAHVHRIFMGGFGGVGATLVGVSILSNAKMLGGFAPTTLATAATPLMMAAAPIVTVFGTGIAAYEGYKFARTVQTSQRMPAAFNAEDEDEALAHKLLQERLVALRIVGGLKGGSYLGLAIGVPATVFGGPYGIPIMVTSAAGMVASGVLEGVMVGYRPQVGMDERLQLPDVHAISTAVAHASRQRGIIKSSKRMAKQSSSRANVLACIQGLRELSSPRGQGSVNTQSDCCVKHQVQTLMDFLMEHNAMRDFGSALVSHKSLRVDFAKYGVVNKVEKEWHFDAHALVTRLSESGGRGGVDAIAEHTFRVAEKVLRKSQAKRLLWRQRHLLDLLALEVMKPRAERPQG